MRKLNVLIFPAGTEIGLEVHKSLKYCKDITLYGASSVSSNHAPFVFKNYLMMKSITDAGFIEELNGIIKAYSIDYIFPAHDDVILFMSDNRKYIDGKIVCPDIETCTISRFKSLTYKKLSGSVRVPKCYNIENDIPIFPVFVKPDKGEGSRGARVINTADELRQALATDPSLLVMEYLTGEEFTVDCFSDREKGLLYASARKRIRTRNGISMHSETISNKNIYNIAEKIQENLKFYGAWFFQVKYSSDGELTLLEVAPRIPGTMCVSRASGANLPLLSIYEHERANLDILVSDKNIVVDRALDNKYCIKIDYDTVYIDLDDTIIINSKVNTQAISFIYQCINNGKKIILITRHCVGLEEYLDSYRIKHLFDEIHIVKKEQSKAEFIKTDRSIFIDDSFTERRDVAEKTKITTFDCSQIEALIDSKM